MLVIYVHVALLLSFVLGMDIQSVEITCTKEEVMSDVKRIEMHLLDHFTTLNTYLKPQIQESISFANPLILRLRNSVKRSGKSSSSSSWSDDEPDEKVSEIKTMRKLLKSNTLLIDVLLSAEEHIDQLQLNFSVLETLKRELMSCIIEMNMTSLKIFLNQPYDPVLHQTVQTTFKSRVPGVTEELQCIEKLLTTLHSLIACFLKGKAILKVRAGTLAPMYEVCELTVRQLDEDISRTLVLLAENPKDLKAAQLGNLNELLVAYQGEYENYSVMRKQLIKIHMLWPELCQRPCPSFLSSKTRQFRADTANLYHNFKALNGLLLHPDQLDISSGSYDMELHRSEMLFYRNLVKGHRDDVLEKSLFTEHIQPAIASRKIKLITGHMEFAAESVIMHVNKLGCAHDISEAIQGHMSSPCLNLYEHPQFREHLVVSQPTYNMRGLRLLRAEIHSQFVKAIKLGASVIVVHNFGCSQCGANRKQIVGLYEEAFSLFAGKGLQIVNILDEELIEASRPDVISIKHRSASKYKDEEGCLIVNPKGCPHDQKQFKATESHCFISPPLNVIEDVWLQKEGSRKPEFNSKGMKMMRTIVQDQFQAAFERCASVIVVVGFGCDLCVSSKKQIAHLYAEAISVFKGRSVKRIVFCDKELYKLVAEEFDRIS